MTVLYLVKTISGLPGDFLHTPVSLPATISTFSKQKTFTMFLSIAPRKSIQVTKAKPTITVGDNSYLSVRGDGNNPKVILTRGKENGHMLLIESANGLPFRMVDDWQKNKTQLNGNFTMKGSSTLLLVWSGLRWVQVSYSKNF